MKKHTLFALIIGLAFLLRLPLLNGSFWLDEAAQALESIRPFSQQHLIADDFQPPLLHYITHFMLYVSHDEWWLRMTSVIAGVLTVGFLYLILDRVHSRHTAIIGSLLLATSSFHIFFSQELRPYALAAFFATLSWWALIASTTPLENGKKKSTHKSYWVVFTVASIAGLYSMYVYPFIVLSQLLYTVIEKRSYLRQVLLSFAVTGLVFLPWIPFFVQQLGVGTKLAVTLPGWSQVVSVPQLKVLPLTFAKFFIGQVEIAGDAWRMVLVAIPILFVFFSSIRLFGKKEYRYILYWCYIPILGAWLISFFVPVIAPKRVMIALPALWALVGVAITQFFQRSASADRRFWNDHISPSLVLFVFLMLNIVTLSMYYTTPQYQRENWRDLVRGIEAMPTQPAVALFAFPESFAPWRWYTSGTVSAVATGTVYLSGNLQLDPLLSGVRTYRRVYLFDYLRDLSDPSHRLESWLETNGYEGSSVIDGGKVGFVRVYEKR